MNKKMLAVILVVCMIVTSLVGCGSNKGANNATQAVDSNLNETGYPIVKEPITLTAMICIRDVDSLASFKDMPGLQELEKKTGVHIEWDVVKAADWEIKLNLMFASGTYPDLIFTAQNTLNDEEYGVSQKLLIPLGDLTEKYMPTYTQRIAGEAKDPTLSLVASDNNIYSVGFMVAQKIFTDQEFFINQTWLKNLNIAMPTTIDQLTSALRAFKNNDPNGNGKADEIPLSMGIDSGFYGIKYMLPMFGVPVSPGANKWIYIDDNKKVQFAPTQPGFRKCMEWLNTLYKEQLLDPEVLSQKSTGVEAKLKAGTVGFFNAWRLGGMGWDTGATKDCVLYTPKSTTTSPVSLYRKLEMTNDGAYVTSTNKHVEASMRWLDSLLDTETMFSLYYGPKDTGWKYGENGKIDIIVPATSPTVKTFPDCNSLFFGPANYISSVFNMSATRIEKTNNDSSYDAAGIIQKYSGDYLTLAPLSTDQMQNNALIETDINNAVVENIAYFISNGVTDAKWNDFIKLANSLGNANYIKTYQDAIDKMDLK